MPRRHDDQEEGRLGVGGAPPGRRPACGHLWVQQRPPTAAVRTECPTPCRVHRACPTGAPQSEAKETHTDRLAQLMLGDGKEKKVPEAAWTWGRPHPPVKHVNWALEPPKLAVPPGV